MSEQIQKWRSQREAFREGLQYIDQRRKGLVKSLQTPWKKFNDAGTNGIEWHTMTALCARAAVGKTTMKDQLVRESFVLNPGEDFRVLDFQFEMLAKVSAVREFSSVLGKSYKYLASAEENILSDVELERCFNYSKKRVEYPVDVVDDPCTVKDMTTIIESYMKVYSQELPQPVYLYKDQKPIMDENGKHVFEIKEVTCYKKTLICIDHALLVLEASREGQNAMLHDLCKMCTKLKRKYPISFLLLNHLNRQIESPERYQEGHYGNYINTSDISGSDAILQHADMIIGGNRPGYFKIHLYGPDQYIIEDEDVLVYHFLKCRNGDTRMAFFKGDFEKMKIIEIPTPPMANSVDRGGKIKTR